MQCVYFERRYRARRYLPTYITYSSRIYKSLMLQQLSDCNEHFLLLQCVVDEPRKEIIQPLSSYY